MLSVSLALQLPALGFTQRISSRTQTDDVEVVPARHHRTPKAGNRESSRQSHVLASATVSNLATLVPADPADGPHRVLTDATQPRFADQIRDKESEEAHIMTCARRQENLFPKHKSKEG